MKKPYIIFDLDATVINSNHRVKHALVDGIFNLVNYFKFANTSELIGKDSLLPLACYMKVLAAQGTEFSIITARTFKYADSKFLTDNKLINFKTKIFDRSSCPTWVRELSDSDYKRHQFNKLQQKLFNESKTPNLYQFFDDNKEVLAEFSNDVNIHMIDAIGLNKKIAVNNPTGDDNLLNTKIEINSLAKLDQAMKI